MKKRVIALALGCTVAFGCAVGGTLAWLTDSTDEVKNVFTTSDVDIELTETNITAEDRENEYKMVPGATLTKDPKVTVIANSEPCYVFVKVEENLGAWADNDTDKTFKDYLDYSVVSTDVTGTNGVESWQALDDVPGVYYMEIDSITAENTDYQILNDNKVTVDSSVTRTMMKEIATDTNYPKLTFIAYAIQKNYLTDQEGTAITNAAEAWKLISQD